MVGKLAEGCTHMSGEQCTVGGESSVPYSFEWKCELAIRWTKK